MVNGRIQVDARGSVFQFVDPIGNRHMAMSVNGTYIGNILSDMQIMVAKAISDGVLVDSDLLQTGVNTIDSSVIQWAESGTTSFSPHYRCNGDSMHHVTKGMVVIRIDDTKGFEIRDNRIEDIENLSHAPFANCTDYNAANGIEDLSQQGIGNIRMISVAASGPFDRDKHSVIENNYIRDAVSLNANHVIGIDIQGETTGLLISLNDVDLRHAGQDVSEVYAALRIRSNVDRPAVVVLGDNKFAQEVKDLTVQRRLQNKFHGTLRAVGESSGRCPYAKTLPGRK